MRHTKLTKPVQVRVNQTAGKVEEEGPLPLDVVLLKQTSQQGECLLPHQERLVLETGGDGGDVWVNFGGVAYGKIAQDDDDVVTNGWVLRGEELPCHLHH